MSKLPGDFGDSKEKFNPAEMERRIQQMRAEGKIPSLQDFAQVMGMVRDEWQKGTFHQPTGSPRKSHIAARRPN